MNAAGVAGGQQFGYDGFGNLLSQMPIFGTAPMMSLAVNPNTNEVISGGAVYDGAGNLTSAGTNTYTFDAMNRMTSDGLLTYSYRPGDNKEMAAYYTGTNEPPFLTLFLRDPSGRLLATSSYTQSGSNWYMNSGSLSTRLYLGGKALSYAENNVGSTAASTFWPYGGLNTGTAGVFGTYEPGYAMYYADQRFYYSNWDRFLTADPSDANIDPTVSGSFNRFAYVNGDPINGMDPKGLDNQVCFGNLGEDCFDIDDGDDVFGEFAVTYDENGNIQSVTNIQNQESVTVNGDDPDSVSTDASDSVTPAPINNPNEQTSPFNSWPFNGNTLPLEPRPQDGVCTMGALSPPMNANPAILACCQAHDKCYAAHGCNATSWLPNPLPWGVCNACNAKVAACITSIYTYPAFETNNQKSNIFDSYFAS